MFKGVDRAKYDIRDPSVRHAIKRDEALHKESLVRIARYLNTPPPKQNHVRRVPQILLPPKQRAELVTRVPASMRAFADNVLVSKAIPRDKKF